MWLPVHVTSGPRSNRQFPVPAYVTSGPSYFWSTRFSSLPVPVILTSGTCDFRSLPVAVHVTYGPRDFRSTWVSVTSRSDPRHFRSTSLPVHVTCRTGHFQSTCFPVHETSGPRDFWFSWIPVHVNAHELCTRAEPCDWSAGAQGFTTMLGVTYAGKRVLSFDYYILSRPLSTNTPSRMSIIIFRCFVLSNYCLLVWNFCGAAHTSKTERIQHRALKFITMIITPATKNCLPCQPTNLGTAS